MFYNLFPSFPVNISSAGDQTLPLMRSGRLCAQCGNPKATKKCGKCMAAYYCSVNCQKANWPAHKLQCGTTQTQPSQTPGNFTMNVSDSSVSPPPRDISLAAHNYIANFVELANLPPTLGLLHLIRTHLKSCSIGPHFDVPDFGSPLAFARMNQYTKETLYLISLQQLATHQASP